MRKKTLDQGYLDFSIKSTLKVVQEYRTKYEGIGQILEANPKILDIGTVISAELFQRRSMAEEAKHRNKYCDR